MKKYIYSIFVIGLMFLSSFVYAEEGIGQGDRPKPTLYGENKIEVDIKNGGEKKDIQKEVRDTFNNLKIEKDVDKSKIEEMKENRNEERTKIQNEIQNTREEFRLKIEEKRQEMKKQIEENRVMLKEKLKIIKDEKKQNLVLNIDDNINKINVRTTDRLNEFIDKIESILTTIEKKRDEILNNGLDVVEITSNIEIAKVKILEARESLSLQIGKTYEIKVVDEASLKDSTQSTRDTFKSDLKIVQEKIKEAQEATRVSAKSLVSITAQVQTVDETEVTVEGETTTNVETE